jgi:hypothetical protein
VSKVFLILFFFTALCQAQNKEVLSQNLYWTRYYNQAKLGKKSTLHTEVDNRTFFKENRHHHLISHIRFHYRFNKNVEIGTGFTYSRQSPHEENKPYLMVPEYRPNQELNISNHIGSRFSLQHRFRIDERFTKNSNGVNLEPGFRFNVRYRYRFQSTVLLTKASPLYLKIANELMLNQTTEEINNVFDQNRVYVGLEKELNPHFNIEIGYMKWYQIRQIQDQYFDRNILRITLLHKIKLSKKL